MNNRNNGMNPPQYHQKMMMMPNATMTRQASGCASSLPKGLINLNYLVASSTPSSSFVGNNVMGSGNINNNNTRNANFINVTDNILNEVIHESIFDIHNGDLNLSNANLCPGNPNALSSFVPADAAAITSRSNGESISSIIFDDHDDKCHGIVTDDSDDKILPCPISPSQDDIKVVDNVHVADNSWYANENVKSTLLTLLVESDSKNKKRKADDSIESIDDIDILGDDDIFDDDNVLLFAMDEDSNATMEKSQRNKRFKTDDPSLSLFASLYDSNTNDLNYNSDAPTSTNEDEGSNTIYDDDSSQQLQKRRSSKASATSASDLPAPSNCERYFRNDQSEKWTERFHDLIQYRAAHGHCNVPHKLVENQQLAQWVKRQRYQYKLKHQYKKHSTLTDEREALLDNLGFIWDSHKVLWDERFEELMVFKAKVGHCRVPCNFRYNRPLSIWVKCQRRQYKLFQTNQPTNMTQERIERLNAIGFAWDPRTSS